MKSYNELKAEMEEIQQQMVEAKQNELANCAFQFVRPAVPVSSGQGNSSLA